MSPLRDIRAKPTHDSWDCMKFFDFDPRGWEHPPHALGQCPRCRRYFQVVPSMGDLRFWKPVRWWNFDARKRIARIKALRGAAGGMEPQ